MLQHLSRRAAPDGFPTCSECAALVHLEKGPSDRFSEQFPGIGFSYKTLIELVPLAAYAIRAPDGAIVWYNSRAADLWVGDPSSVTSMSAFAGLIAFTARMVRTWRVVTRPLPMR